MKNNIILRPYQEEAIDKAVWGIENFENNSLIVGSQGCGKSLIIAGTIDKTKKESLILQPSRELLAQNKEKLSFYVPDEEIGVYSASFKRKDIGKYTFATIQSVYKNPELFKHIELVFIDEAHGVTNKNTASMYSSFLKGIGNPSVLGLTATPYRNVVASEKLKSGEFLRTTMLKMINRTLPKMWHRILFNLNMDELISQGYLVPLKYEIKNVIPHNKIPRNKSSSDFDLEAFEKLLSPVEGGIIEDINERSKQYNSVLVFCSSVNQAERLASTLINSAVVTATTPTKEREKIVEGFKLGTIKTVFNVATLTTGFDHPALDCIFMLRPTRSLSLYGQIGGRGSRLSPATGKTHCLIVDYSGNVESLGKVEDIKVGKNSDGLWDVFANGEPQHGKGLFTQIASKDNQHRVRIKVGGQNIHEKQKSLIDYFN